MASNGGWSPERAKLVQEYKDQFGVKATAEHFGIKPRTVTTMLAQAVKDGYLSKSEKMALPVAGRNKGPDHTAPEPDERVVELPYLTSIDQLLKACEVDTDLWEVERQVVNKWDVTLKDKNQNPVTKQNLQLKAFLRHKFAGIDFDELRKALEKLPKADSWDRNVKPVKNPHLLEINIPDLHYGSLCWEPESGENYDSKIAEKRFLTAIERLLSLASGFNVERIQLPIGSDYFNSDTPFDTTTAGTQQHNDGRWQKVYAEGLALLISAIDRLRQVAPVEVILVQGNHDYQLSYCAAHTIDVYFAEDPHITVDWSPKERKYKVYGDSLLCHTHGKSANGRAIPDKQWLKIITSEAGKQWGDTKFHEVHAGHTHHQTTTEDGALVIQHLGSLSGTTAYEYSSGYVGSRKVAHAFVWHKKQGPIAHLKYHV